MIVARQAGILVHIEHEMRQIVIVRLQIRFESGLNRLAGVSRAHL